MAYIQAEAILDRLRAILEAGAGDLRTIPADDYSGGLWGDLSPNEQSRRATYKPIAEASILGIAPHPSRCSVTSNVGLLAITIEVSVVRHVGPEHMAVDTLRDQVKALAVLDADVVSQALGYPGNLDRPTTGIVSGLLTHVESDIELALPSDGTGPGTVTTTHVFTGVVQTAPGVGPVPPTGAAFTEGFTLGFLS